MTNHASSPTDVGSLAPSGISTPHLHGRWPMAARGGREADAGPLSAQLCDPEPGCSGNGSLQGDLVAL
jgi:hypothetical protein